MAIENLKVVLDGANAGLLKTFDQAGSSAESNMGKATASTSKTSAALDALQANALPIVGAVVGGLVKLGTSFADQAVAAGKFATQTGLSVEEASKLTNVADDLGVSTESLGGSMNKMLKTAGATPKVFEDLGVAIVKTKSGAVDSEATFLGVIDHLKAIKDPAQRAAEGTKLLGKSWADAAPLIDEGSASLRQMMDSTPKGDIFHQSDVDSGKAMKAAFNDLGDAMQALGNTLGKQVVPQLTQVAEGATQVASALGPVVGFLGKIGAFQSPIAGVVNEFKKFGDQALTLDVTTGALGDMLAGIKATTAASTEATEASQGYGAGLIEYSSAAGQAKAAEDDRKQALDASTAAVKKATDGTKAYMDALNNQRNAAIDAIDKQHAYRDSQLDTAQAVQDLGGKLAEQDKIIQSKKATDDERATALRAEAGLINDVSGKIEDNAKKYAESKGAVDGSRDSINLQIQSLGDQAAALAPGSPVRTQIEEYIAALKAIPTSVKTDVSITQSGQVGGGAVKKKGGGVVQFAAGGNYEAGVPRLTGENGPELDIPDHSGTVIPAGPTGRILAAAFGKSGMTATINMYGTNVTAGDVQRALTWGVKIGAFG